MRSARLLGVGGVTAVLALSALAACSKGGTTAGPTTGDVAVAATDTTCGLARTNLAAGVTKFVITNSGNQITEFEVFQGTKVLGEVENISPQTTRNLTVELAAGSYDGVCKPGMAGDGVHTPFTVSGSANALSEDQKLARAVTDYTSYIQGQVALLVPKTKEFDDAVRGGNLAQAKALYPIARGYYEAIEPVAESFGDLDPKIDARDGDVDPGTPWTGFHRIEKDLWVTGDISKDKALADQLDTDVNQLATLVKTVQLKPLEIANGAKELLDEVATQQDHRRGGPLLAHRPVGLRRQRGRLEGGHRRAAAGAGGARRGSSVRCGRCLHPGAGGARPLQGRRRLEALHRPDPGRHQGAVGCGQWSGRADQQSGRRHLGSGPGRIGQPDRLADHKES